MKRALLVTRFLFCSILLFCVFVNGVFAQSILSIVSGNNQTGPVNQALPIGPVVKVMNANGTPLASATLTVTASAGQVNLPVLSNTSVNYTSGGSELKSTEWKAFLFTTGNSIIVSDRVSIVLNSMDGSYGPTPPSIQVEAALYTVVNGFPSVEIGTSGLQSFVLPGTATWATLNFSTPIELNPSTSYALVLKSNSIGVKWANVTPDQAPQSDLSNVSSVKTLNGGASWSNSGVYNAFILSETANFASTKTISTNANGTAALGSWVLGDRAGTQELVVTNASLSGSPLTITATATAVLPSAPTNLSYTPGNGQVSLSFTPGYDGGSVVTNFEYSLDNGTSWTALNPVDTSSPITITGLTNGTTYPVKIRAVNAAGQGAASAAISVNSWIPLSNPSIAVDPIPNQTYTGAALTPAIVVKDGSTTLSATTDYTITSYEDNINLGTATVTITGAGNYSGTKTQTFTIVAKAASTLAIDAIANQTYTGSALTPAVVVKDGNTTLTATTDYMVAYTNNTNVGTATVTITGEGNYSGTKTQTFSIVAKSASTLTIDAITNQTYTGSALTPALLVKDGSTTLTATTDYTVAYTNNTNVGTATATITGAGNYSGTKTQTFSIVAKAASTLSIDAIANQNFTGAAITPTAVVKDGNTTLTLGIDYSVAYSNNTNVGTATVTITGVGNYIGTKTQTFAITSKPVISLTIDPIADQTYTGSALTPVLVVKDGATTLTRGTDYSVAYSNNTNVGTATVTITGIGIYVGTKTQTFAIVAKAASTLSIDAIANQTYTGSALTPTVVVKDGSTTLTATTDYTVAYTTNTNVGTATVMITGAGNYSGTKTQTFSIVAKAASTLSIDAIANQTYTGSALTPAVVVKDGNTTLTATTDYTVAYTNNTNVGTATVTITGAGNYTGTKTQTFTIVAKAASTLSIDAIANQAYTGSALTPTVVVKDGSTTLTLGTDYTVAYTNNTNVGTATVTITGAGNYSGTKTQTFAIQPKALTIRAVNATKVYGDANPSLSFMYSGLVEGDTEINQLPSISTSATTTSGAGNYPITLTGGSDPNYSLTREEGVLEITPAKLVVIVNAATKIYGQEDPEFTFSLQGLKASYSESILRGGLIREAGEEPGTYRIASGTISAGANYTLSVMEANLQILKARALSVAELALVTTDWSKEAALPATVNLLATHGQYFQVEVKWDKSKLNLLARGTYSLTGTLLLPAGIENPDQVLAKIKVQVLPKPAPREVTIDNSTFVGSTSVFFIPVGAFVITDPVDKTHVVSFLGDGYDNKFFFIKDNVLYWNSAERAPGKTKFTIVVRVTDRDGNTLDKLFEIKRTRLDFSSLTINTTYTPNGDRFNDAWGVPELRFYEGVRVSVYERGGGRVFYTENPDIRWDGTYNGKEMPAGSYFWTIEVIETGELRRGMLNLIRK